MTKFTFKLFITNSKQRKFLNYKSFNFYLVQNTFFLRMSESQTLLHQCKNCKNIYSNLFKFNSRKKEKNLNSIHFN